MPEQAYISFYKFVEIPDPQKLCDVLQSFCKRESIQGTVLIAGEGINGMLAGQPRAILKAGDFFRENLGFTDMKFKESVSQSRLFKKLIVKVKKQILTLRNDSLAFPFKGAPYVSPEQLNAWLKTGEDLVLLDTRNGFEVAMGTFKNAFSPGTKNFSEFPEYVRKNLERFKDKRTVTFCTGGIRCEKASAILLREGAEEVYQLGGGILEYFTKTDGAFFEGNCFVFDDRVAVDKKLKPVNGAGT